MYLITLRKKERTCDWTENKLRFLFSLLLINVNFLSKHFYLWNCMSATGLDIQELIIFIAAFKVIKKNYL